MITILGNLRINSAVRLEHLKASFKSIDKISDNWLINVRGTFREEAIKFLKDELGDRMVAFELLDDNRGWLTNALDMLKKAKYEYVLVWLEDHINIAPQQAIIDTVRDMKNNHVDYLGYSWWMMGKSRKLFDDNSSKIELKREKNISYLNLTKDKWKYIRKQGFQYFLVSMCGIYRKDFLVEMMKKDRKRLPIFLKKTIFKIMGLLTKLKIISSQGHKLHFDRINRIFFFNKIRKYPKVTPFEIEKGPERWDILPFTLAFPNQELLACIDDNANDRGYSLVERGIYKTDRDLSIDYGRIV